MLQFNEEQIWAHDTIVRLALQEPDIMAENGGIGRLIVLIGVGGTGKSTMVNGIITRSTLKLKEGWVEDNYAIFATTAGLAAMNVPRSTVYCSWKEGLGFPVGLTKCAALKGQTLPRI
jgi:ABC-type polysaccharide/polyol phosphate transport system ATPase subunit